MADGPPTGAPKRTLPMLWKSGDNEIRDRAVVIASDKEVASFSDQRVTTCGSCRHFRGPNKDRGAISRFMAMAIYEAGWKKEFLGHPPEQLGRCAENEATCTGPHSRSCDHYTPDRGRIK